MKIEESYATMLVTGSWSLVIRKANRALALPIAYCLLLTAAAYWHLTGHGFLLSLVKIWCMNNPRISVPVVIVGMVLFMVLCNSHIDIPSELLFTMLLLIHAGLIWMVVTIVRSKPVHGGENTVYRDIKFKNDKTF